MHASPLKHFAVLHSRFSIALAKVTNTIKIRHGSSDVAKHKHTNNFASHTYECHFNTYKYMYYHILHM